MPSKPSNLGLDYSLIGLDGKPEVKAPISVSRKDIQLDIILEQFSLGATILDGTEPVEDNYYFWLFENSDFMLFEDGSYIMWTE